MSKRDLILSNLTTRPPRIVFFIDKNIRDWKRNILDIIEMYSEIWGGMYNLIIPYSAEPVQEINEFIGTYTTYKINVEKIFLDILQIYDADYYLLYEDFSWKPDNYWRGVYSSLEEFLNKNKLSFLNTYYIFNKNRFRMNFEKKIIPIRFLKERLKKYEFDSFINYEHKGDLSIIDLIVYSQIGKFDKEKYENKIPLTTTSTVNISTFFFEGIEDEIHYTIGELFGEYPFYTTLIDTRIYYIRNSNYNFTDIVIVDEEESIENFLLYYNLQRLNVGKTIYINNTVLNSKLFNLKEELQTSEIIFSNKPEQLCELLWELRNKIKKIEISKINLRKIYSEEYQFLSKIERNSITINFSPDLSKYYKGLYPIFTFNFDNYLLPNSFIKNMLEPANIRTSVEGFHSEQLIYNFPYLDAFSIFEDILKKNMDRFFEFLSNNESISNIKLEFSDKGMYFNYIYNDIFNKDFEDLKNFFLNDSHILILYFSKLSREIPDSINKVLFLMQKFGIDKERFLKYLKREKSGRVYNNRAYFIYEDLEKFYQELGIKDYVRIIDKLLKKNIIERGYILRCKYCSNTDFYYFNEILENSSFKCKRCNLKQKILKENISFKDSIDLKVVYTLNEVIFQYIDNDGLVPLFTLFKLENLAKASFNFSPEFKVVGFTDKKQEDKIEFDISVIIDGKVVLGECKRNLDSFSDLDINKFIKAIEAFKVDNVVFSTFDERLPREKDRIKDLIDSLQNKNFEIIEFSKNEFLNM